MGKIPKSFLVNSIPKSENFLQVYTHYHTLQYKCCSF
eukprot:UN21970